ncbi:MAG: HPr(Ser) kinase/phosphatase [Candidatus Izemoplasma sp.]
MKLTALDIYKDNNYEIIAGNKGLSNEVHRFQVSKPGIELAGLFDFYEYDRIQVLGSKEIAFFGWLNESKQEIRVDMLFEKRPPMFIFSKNVKVPDIFIRKGNKYNTPIFISKNKTSELTSSLYQYLASKLAERKSLHGTLVDVNGVGVLIKGKSGLGKSEIALELVRRGHQLVADDRVDIYQKEKGIIVGEAPNILKKYLEIRGIGIINVVQLFGARAYKENKKVMLIVELEKWNDAIDYDRLGLNDQTELLFDTLVPYIKIPITEARNVASLVEVAAMNASLKFLGTNSALEFTEALSIEINKK